MILSNMIIRIQKAGELEEAGDINLVTEVYDLERASAVLSTSQYHLSCIHPGNAILDACQRESQRKLFKEMLFTDRYLYGELIADVVKNVAGLRAD